ncbi:MAG TPA: PQQ-binding-like beta-propeller repeat protein [Candidatus Baltobacteraceae bacterium]|jgi:alcohol dehydrogenase (cytochrome c)|nr:PQQ-binding-like beta-propeller repeat protein [Candidatus Baltobacteraceae bacterium]
MRSCVVLICTTILLAACAGGNGGQNSQSSQTSQTSSQSNLDWPLPGNTYGFNRYVNFPDITPQNVGSLRKAWITPLADDGEQESSPIVSNGTVYIATPHDNVLALSGKTGALKWAFPYTPAYVILYAVNRGVGVANGKVFVGTQDCRAIALDASSGKKVWDVLGCEGTSGSSSTQNSWYSIAAYPYNGAVYLSTAGGDNGNIGLVSAFDQNTGKRLWNWHTVPHPGEPNFGTWPGNSWQHGGAAVWAGMSFDPGAQTLFVAPGNAGPNLTLYGRKGRDLYSNSVVALNIGGAQPTIRWYYQVLQNDTHDSDPAMPPVVFQGRVAGSARALLAIGDKAGDFVILDRTNGKPVYRMAVSKQQNILLLPTPQGIFACPNHGGGVEWNGGSYDPATNYFIIPSTQECAIFKVTTTGPVAYVPGQPYSAGPLPKRQNATGIITAIDIGNGKIAWRKAVPYPAQGGVTITSTGVAFTSDTRGRIYALDPRTGRELWHDDTGSSVVDSLSLYRIGGKPYLVTIAGEAGNQHTPNLPPTQGSRVLAYSLGVANTMNNTVAGQPTPAPMPTGGTESGQTAGTNASAPYTPAQAAAGKALYMQKCSSCHGAALQGISAPALTGAAFARSHLSISQLRTIVTTQMPLGAPGSLTPAQYASIMAFLLQYDCVSPSNGGKTPFPTSDQPALAKIVVPGATCPVK